MSVAPELYLSACLTVLYRATIACRVWGWSGQVSPEHLADLMDAIHNIPQLIREWERCDVELLRTAFLQVYEKKWLGRGGLPLCQIFDEIIAQGEGNDEPDAAPDSPRP
jgi:hypothetical protein